MKYKTETKPQEGKTKILLFEDDPHVSSTLIQGLERRGYSVLHFSDSNKLLAVIEDESIEIDYTIALIDRSATPRNLSCMGGKYFAGDAIASELKERYKSRLVVSCSGISDKSPSADVHLTKPFTAPDFDKFIHEQLANRKYPRPQIDGD